MAPKSTGPPVTNSGPVTTSMCTSPTLNIPSSKTGTGPAQVHNKGKLRANSEWVQKERTTNSVVSQQIQYPPMTNALVIYTAPNISTANSFEALNCSIPEGLDNDDVQEDLLARAEIECHIPYVVNFPRDSVDPPCTTDQRHDTRFDGDTASESEEEIVENYTNDPITPKTVIKPAKKRGPPKKEKMTAKPP